MNRTALSTFPKCAAAAAALLLNSMTLAAESPNDAQARARALLSHGPSTNVIATSNDGGAAAAPEDQARWLLAGKPTNPVTAAHFVAGDLRQGVADRGGSAEAEPNPARALILRDGTR